MSLTPSEAGWVTELTPGEKVKHFFKALFLLDLYGAQVLSTVNELSVFC